MQRLNVILHVLVFLTIAAWGDYNISTMAQITGCFFVNALFTGFSLKKLSQQSTLPEGGMIISIILLYWIGYLTKFGLGMWIAGQYWVVPILISEGRLLEALPDAFIVFTFGYAGLLAGALTFASGTPANLSIYSIQPRFALTAAAIIIGMAMKFVLKQVFLLDVPGEVPVNMGVPMLAGALALLISTGFLFFTNILLFCALAAGKTAYAFLGFALAIVNALIDLRFGSKDTILYQVTITAIYIYSIRKYLKVDPLGFSRVARKVVALVGILGSVVVAVYPYMNSYRNAIRAGADIGQAVNEALYSDFAASKNSFIELYNRITGLETLAAIIQLREQLATSDIFGNLFTTHIIDTLTFELLGSSQVMTRFSVTFFGQIYSSLGYTGTAIGCFLLSACFMLLIRTAMSLPVHSAMKLAFVPILWILLVQALLGGGNLPILAKELLSVFIALLAFSRLALSAPRRTTKSFSTNGRAHLRYASVAIWDKSRSPR